MRSVFVFCFLLCVKASQASSESTKVEGLFERAYAHLEGNQDSAMILAVEAEKIAHEQKYLWGEANALYIQGYIYDIKGEPSKALVNYLKAEYLLEASDELQSVKTRIDLLMNSAIILSNHYKYHLALEFYEEALAFSEKYDLTGRRAQAWYNMGADYRYVGDLNQAAECILKSLTIAYEIEDAHLILSDLNELGLIYKDDKDYEAARVAYQKILEYDFKDLDQVKYIGRANHNIAVTYFEEEDYQMAEHHFLKALEAKKVHEIPKDIFITLMDLTELHITTGEYEAAKEVGLRAQSYYDRVSLKAEHFKIFNFLSKTHYALEEYKDAAAYSDLYVEESEKFDAAQEEVLKLREQYKIDLILAGFYQEISREEEASFHRKVIMALLTGFFLTLLAIGLVHTVRKRILKSGLERALRTIESESSM